LASACRSRRAKQIKADTRQPRPNAGALASIHEEGIRLQVLVRDNNVDQALKALKKKMQREGIFREMKLRNYYEKPSERRVREKAEAVRRARKLARKRAQREGLLPGKPAKPAPTAGAFGASPSR
jgi:small subunit ribosomal protein S21